MRIMKPKSILALALVALLVMPMVFTAWPLSASAGPSNGGPGVNTGMYQGGGTGSGSGSSGGSGGSSGGSSGGGSSTPKPTSPPAPAPTDPPSYTYYTVTATAGTGGTITPSGSTSVREGRSRTYTIAANEGYEIADVTLNGVSQGKVPSLTFTVNGNRTVVASFSRILDTDLSVTSITPIYARVGLSMLSLVTYHNSSETAATTMLAFSAGGASQSKAITVPAGASGSTVFTWTPGSVGNVTVSANINPDKSIEEIDYGNNVLSESVMVKEIVDPADPNDTPDPVSLIDPPAGENNDYVEWTDPNGNTYWARLTLTATPSTTKSKSGYGFDVTVTPFITTNCPDSSVIMQPQAVVMRIPETHYETGVQLVKSGTTWSMPVNPISVIGSKVWFVPIWFPDVNYVGVVTSYGAFTPGGELTASMPVTIAINGSMYEDDSTNNAWGG